MQIDLIKGFLKRKLFKPFVVRAASRKSHKIKRIEAVALSPEGDLVILWPSEGRGWRWPTPTRAPRPPIHPGKGAIE